MHGPKAAIARSPHAWCSHPALLVQPLLEVVQGFLAIERQALRQDMRQREASGRVQACIDGWRVVDCIARRGMRSSHALFSRALFGRSFLSPVLQAATAAAELAPVTQQQPQLGTPAGGSNWQKKGGGAALAGPSVAGPWVEALGAAALLSAAGGSSGLDSTDLELGAAEEAAAAARGGPRQELVLVASLLTKAPNLAGLARTCEVFRWGGGGGGGAEGVEEERAGWWVGAAFLRRGTRRGPGSLFLGDSCADPRLCLPCPAGPARWCLGTWL